MTKQTITIGAVPNDGTGDPLRTAFTKVNANFTELYAADLVPGPTGATGPIGVTGPTGFDFSLILTDSKVGTYTLELTDKNKMISISSNVSSLVVVPADTSVAFEYGTKVYVKRGGTGAVGVTGEGLVVIQSAQGLLNLKYQYSVATLLKNGANTWTLYGDIS